MKRIGFEPVACFICQHLPWQFLRLLVLLGGDYFLTVRQGENAPKTSPPPCYRFLWGLSGV